jgi:3D (Asp-Asp-Asp) domain-containing protein
MGSAKLATHVLLALASLSAAAHRPAPSKHHATSSKHQPTASHLKKAAHKQVAKASKHRKAASKSSKVAGHHRAKTHQLALASSKHHPAPGQRHTYKHPASVAHHSAKHQAQPQPAGRTYNVTATVYQAVPGQTDGSPFITADNSRIRPRYGSHTRWLALSPDLLKQGGGRFHYGDKVQVSRVSPQLDGVYTVHDTMNRRHRHRIDILTHRREKLSVFAPGAKLRLAGEPKTPRKSRAQATAVAHARPGRGSQARAVSFRSRASHKRTNYLASAIL